MLTDVESPSRSVLTFAVARLEHEVVERYRPGQYLRAEGDLATDLAVSRTTVREALKVLAGRGYVELSKGRRPRVLGPDSSFISAYLAMALTRDPRALLELHAVRSSLEILAATSSAASATTAGVGALRRALRDMTAAAGPLDAGGDTDPHALAVYHQADLEFHQTLALASGNRMLALLLDALASCLRASFASSARGRFERGELAQRGVDAHQAVVDAIERHDPRGAERAMRAHLEETERDLITATSRGPVVGHEVEGIGR